MSQAFSAGLCSGSSSLYCYWGAGAVYCKERFTIRSFVFTLCSMSGSWEMFPCAIWWIQIQNQAGGQRCNLALPAILRCLKTEDETESGWIVLFAICDCHPQRIFCRPAERGQGKEKRGKVRRRDSTFLPLLQYLPSYTKHRNLYCFSQWWCLLPGAAERRGIV